MLAHEAHFDGEPCWHVCQYYDRLRLQHKERAMRRALAYAANDYRNRKAREKRKAATMFTLIKRVHHQLDQGRKA